MTEPRCEIALEVEDPTAPAIDRTLLQRAVEATLAEKGVLPGDEPVALTVLVVDRAGSSDLHERFFADPSPTDVMTFPDGETDPVSGRLHLGDLAICGAVAREVAAERADDPIERERLAGEELVLYVVHGVLHLLGYDDRDPGSRARMWERQRIIMHEMGIELVDD